MCLYIYICTRIRWLQYLWVNSITEQKSSTIQRPRISPDHPDPGLMGRSWHRTWLLPQLVACCERDFLWKCPIDEQFGLVWDIENGISKILPRWWYRKFSDLDKPIYLVLLRSPQRVEHDKLSMMSPVPWHAAFPIDKPKWRIWLIVKPARKWWRSTNLRDKAPAIWISLNIHWISTEYPLKYHWISIEYHWISTEYDWISLNIHWISIEFHWISTEYPLNIHWTIEYPLNIHWISTDQLFSTMVRFISWDCWCPMTSIPFGCPSQPFTMCCHPRAQISKKNTHLIIWGWVNTY